VPQSGVVERDLVLHPRHLLLPGSRAKTAVEVEQGVGAVVGSA